MEASSRGVYDCRLKVGVSVAPCGREVVEVPAGEVQGKNILSDQARFRAEFSTKNHGDGSQGDLGKGGKN